MKSKRLPETEIANLAFKSYEVKTVSLRNWLKPKRIKGSYGPLRRSVGEAANVRLPLFPNIRISSVENLEDVVLKECKGRQELIEMNLPPARAIRKFVQEREIDAEYLEELPIILYPGMRYDFWAPILIRYEGAARIVFFDLRRTGCLQEGGLHVCFSIMHERFRALNPDYASVRFETWSFADNSERTIRVIEESKEPISFRRILDDVAETYSILDILRTREDDIGRATSTGNGPLFRR